MCNSATFGAVLTVPGPLEGVLCSVKLQPAHLVTSRCEEPVIVPRGSESLFAFAGFEEGSLSSQPCQFFQASESLSLLGLNMQQDFLAQLKKVQACLRLCRICASCLER